MVRKISLRENIIWLLFVSDKDNAFNNVIVDPTIKLSKWLLVFFCFQTKNIVQKMPRPKIKQHYRDFNSYFVFRDQKYCVEVTRKKSCYLFPNHKYCMYFTRNYCELKSRYLLPDQKYCMFFKIKNIVTHFTL